MLVLLYLYLIEKADEQWFNDRVNEKDRMNIGSLTSPLVVWPLHEISVEGSESDFETFFVRDAFQSVAGTAD